MRLSHFNSTVAVMDELRAEHERLERIYGPTPTGCESCGAREGARCFRGCDRYGEDELPERGDTCGQL